MKLWRKQAMVAGKGTGRRIRNAARLQDLELQGTVKTYPLLNDLFKRVGITNTLSEQDRQTIRGLIAQMQSVKESANEAQ